MKCKWGLLHFYCNKVWWSIAFLLEQSVMVYCISIAAKCGGLLHFYYNKVWWSIAFLSQSAAMQVALDHAPMHCTAFHRQLLLHLSYNWPMEKNSPALFCPISDRNISDIWLQNVTSTRPLCVLDEHKYTPIRYSICSKIGSKQTQTVLCVFVLSPTFQKTEAPQCSRNKYLAERASFLTFSVFLCLARSLNQLWHIEWPNLFNILHNTFNKFTHSIDPTMLEIFLQYFPCFFTFFQWFPVFLTFLSFQISIVSASPCHH